MEVNQVAKISKNTLKLIMYGKTPQSASYSEEQKNVWEDITEKKAEPTKVYNLPPVRRSDFLKRVRMTSSENNLTLLLHFICNSQGEASNVKKSELAKYLNISMKTINRSICGLVRNGIILVKTFVKGYFNFAIVGYEELFEKKKSTGYYSLSLENFKELLKAKSVSHFRVDLYALYKSDFNASHDGLIYLDKKALLSVAPGIAYRKALQQYVSTNNSIGKKFLLPKTTEAKIYVDLSKSGKAILEETEIRVIKEVFPLLPNLSKKDKEDLISLGKQYGLHTLKESIIYLSDSDIFRKAGLQIGAIIRNHIRTYLVFAA